MLSKKSNHQNKNKTPKQKTKSQEANKSYYSFSSYSYVNQNGKTHENKLELNSSDGVHVKGHLVEKINNKKVVDKHFNKLLSKINGLKRI